MSANAYETPQLDPALYQMAYCSLLTHPLSAHEVRVLITNAQRYNAEHGITGLLMMDGNLVVQWLEGSKTQVRTLWNRLLADSRHHCVVELLHRSYPSKRLFPHWSMRHASRAEMLSIVHTARELSNGDMQTPWADAIGALCILLDPKYAAAYAQAMATTAAAVDTAKANAATKSTVY